MANLPAVQDKSSNLTVRLAEGILDRAMAGESLDDIARKLYPAKTKADRQRRRAWIRRAQRVIATDEAFKAALARRAQAELLIALPTASRALAKRAARGRPDAIKLLFEATGFHNPRVKHEHSGDIKITVDIPRPKPVEAVQDSSAEEIQDADVVE